MQRRRGTDRPHGGSSSPRDREYPSLCLFIVHRLFFRELNEKNNVEGTHGVMIHFPPAELMLMYIQMRIKINT